MTAGKLRARSAIIPGSDPEVVVHGELPPFGRWSKPGFATRVSCLDFREDRDRFAELANPLIDGFPARLAMRWFRFNSIACTVEDAKVHNRLIFVKDLPVMGISNLRWEVKAAEVAARGDISIANPQEHFKGRTGLLVGRSSFNYYHFVNDVLVFMENIAHLVDELALDRIIINPCSGGDTSFQRMLVRQLYPHLTDKVIFTELPFSADQLTFVCVWPNYYKHSDGPEPLTLHGPKGVGRRAYRAAMKPFFKRAEKVLKKRSFRRRNKVIVISRREAIRRKTVNEDELLEALAPFGAEPVIMEKLTVPEQMDLMASARVVIGPHGAGMINTGFCQTGATAIELQARHYLPRALMFAGIGIVRNVNYQFVVGDEVGDIENMRGNEGNDIHLGPRAIRHITDTVAAAVAAKSPDDVTGT